MSTIKLIPRSLAIAALALSGAASAVPLADAPIFSSLNVPGNLLMPLSVEYPTALSVTNLGDYNHITTYFGYFDSNKCYTYVRHATNDANSYFNPDGVPSGTGRAKTCNGKWSGNFLNWSTMSSLDSFRWVLTGGYRDVDTATETILMKSWSSGQGGESTYFPRRGTNAADNNKVAKADLPKVTPFNSTSWSYGAKIIGNGTKMHFVVQSANGNPDVASGGTEFNSPYKAATGGRNPQPAVYYDGREPGSFYVQVRVKVCTTSAPESNCVKYGSNYKPQGLMQKYSEKIRYGTMSFLNANYLTSVTSGKRQGGVLRSRMNYAGPTYPTPMSSTPTVNTFAEWNADTGVFNKNPDSALASGSGVSNSGSINFLNKFGYEGKGYMTTDPVGELYYAAMRYLQNRGNVSTWNEGATSTELDGFPAPSNWTDPIIYACQKNFVLGIGDTYTHQDVNVAGSNVSISGRAMPSAVTSDTFNKADVWTKFINQAEGLTGRGVKWTNSGTAYLAGLAYGNHVYDMRPDLDGDQTVSTFWMDVMENQHVVYKNPYWMAAKWGGFEVPEGFDPNNIQDLQDLEEVTWTDGTNITGLNTGGGNSGLPTPIPTTARKPNNFFMAREAGDMIRGLTDAFESIAASVQAYTTSVAPLSNIIYGDEGTTSYSASYDSEKWSGIVKGMELRFNTASTTTSQREVWSTTTQLETQFAGTGWSTQRVVITYDPVARTGLPFRWDQLTPSMKTALDTSYVAASDGSNYLNYLRGDQSNERVKIPTGVYRERKNALGDIVNSKLSLSAAPRYAYSEVRNPGYAAYKTTNASRTPLLLFGANDGMLHALNASTSGSNAGKEVFAYIPSHTFYGPDGSTNANANNNGLAALGSPNYAHRFYVDATPKVFDLDFAKVHSGSGSPDWRTIVVGGLGKGGKGYYALDITNPSHFSTEASAKTKILWEINNSTVGFENLGYSYGNPIVVKTAKYGWTLILTSGYNTPDNLGRIYLVNPKTGELLETLTTNTEAPGMAHASAFINDYANGQADSVYAGDLNGQVWRFNLKAASGALPRPEVFFQTQSNQPITAPPIIEVHPVTRDRMVLFGTGKLLDGTDIEMEDEQSIYGITDGDGRDFEDIDSTLRRSSLTRITNLAAENTIPADSRGWYHDLGLQTNVSGRGQTAWRITLSADARDGIALFSASLTSGDACSPSGSGRSYAVDFSRGVSMLENGDAYVDFSSSPTDNVLMTIKDDLYGLVGTMDGAGNLFKINRLTSMDVQLINWREVNAVE